MEKDLQELTDKDLIALYRLILEHIEYLKNESNKEAKEEEK